jgi:hypothetical protein
MQVLEYSLKGAQRPCAPKDCARCGGCQKLHRHGGYERYRGTKARAQVRVHRYLCPRCGKTWSVIPQDMLPYRPLEISRLEALMDERFGLAGGSARPPPATEIEVGCIRRTCKRVSERMAFLCGLLGQQMPLLAGKDIGWFWRSLRKLGPTEGTLARFIRDFKTSLLGCYRSLLPHWQRESVPG